MNPMKHATKSESLRPVRGRWQASVCPLHFRRLRPLLPGQRWGGTIGGIGGIKGMCCEVLRSTKQMILDDSRSSHRGYHHTKAWFTAMQRNHKSTCANLRLLRLGGCTTKAKVHMTNDPGAWEEVHIKTKTVLDSAAPPLLKQESKFQVATASFRDLVPLHSFASTFRFGSDASDPNCAGSGWIKQCISNFNDWLSLRYCLLNLVLFLFPVTEEVPNKCSQAYHFLQDFLSERKFRSCNYLRNSNKRRVKVYRISWALASFQTGKSWRNNSSATNMSSPLVESEPLWSSCHSLRSQMITA